MPLKQTYFENIVTKDEIAQNKEFLLLSQCFQPFFSNCTFICRYFQCFVCVFKIVCCRFAVCGKGLKKALIVSSLIIKYFGKISAETKIVMLLSYLGGSKGKHSKWFVQYYKTKCYFRNYDYY